MKSRTRVLSLLIIFSIIFSSFPSSTFASTSKIVSIKDLTVAIYVNQTYTLPKTIDATISDNTTKKVAVTWSPKTVVTSKAGTFVYKGTVKGYGKQVLLTLKVEQSPGAEILRAISYGFVPDKLQGDWDKTVTFSEFCTMLKNMLSHYDSKLVPKWEKTATKALTSNDMMHRDHGMLAAYYAACLMGLGQTTNANWHLDETHGVREVNGVDIDFDKWFPDCYKPAPFYDIEYKKRIPGWDYTVCSRFWCMGQTSCVSGNPIFDIDYKKKTVRPMDKFSRGEAIRAVLRMYESTFKPTDQTIGSDTRSTEILALADQRRNSIINSETAITKSDTFIQGKTYTGTAYYISNSGNDLNDGTSPESAWATISKVNSVDFKYGDAVFFERGGTWYGHVWGLAGVTYSAYGTGTKPIISGSVNENAASPEKWELYYTGKKGEKIWVYYRELVDCAGIFMNYGKSWANKIMTYWNGKEYVSATGESLDAITGLTKDLDFFSCVDLTEINPFDHVNATGEPGASGPLYLRCDKGNPGKIYDKIEFSLDGTGISPYGYRGKNMTVDNLKLVYFGSLGVSVSGYQGWTDTLIQNCEIGWCGGGITNYTYDLGNEFAVSNISGGAIQLSGPDNTAINNYIHHCASKSIVVALHDRESVSYIYSDIIIKGNLLEYNAAALHLVNYMEFENPTADSGFKDISFEDNYIMYTGYGWVDTKTLRTDYWLGRLPFSAIEFGGDYRNKNEGIYITDNTFYLSKYVLVNCYMQKDSQPVFSGNTYAQAQNGWLADLRGRLFSVTENGITYVRNELLDKTGTVLTVR